jgi:uncharacterized membrane protein
MTRELEILSNILFLIANMIVLGLNFKLYTEYFKDMSMKKRKED